MAKIINNPKGFKVLFGTLTETMAITHGLGICDTCNCAAIEGYLVAVLNRYLCPDCYDDWMKRAIFYSEDEPFENKVFTRWLIVARDIKIPLEVEIDETDV